MKPKKKKPKKEKAESDSQLDFLHTIAGWRTMSVWASRVISQDHFRQVSPESIVEKVREVGEVRENHEKISPSRPNASNP